MEEEGGNRLPCLVDTPETNAIGSPLYRVSLASLVTHDEAPYRKLWQSLGR